LELEAEDRQETGLDSKLARYAALRAFGNTTLIKEDTREMWGWTTLERVLQDTRYATRVLRKHWSFAVAAMLTLALGIGANTAMFSVVYAVLIEPLPYPQADRLMFVSARDATGAAISFSYPDFLDWQQQTHAFESIAAYQSFGFTVTGTGETQRFPGRTVSAGFFSTLGVTPSLGRDFRPEDDRPGSEPVVIVTDQLWHKVLHGDREIMNRPITLNSRSFTVIGVLPPTFQLYEAGDMFAPIGLGLRASTRGQRKGIYAVGRLRRDATLKQAQLEADAIAQRLAQQYPATNGGIGGLVEPIAEKFVGKTKPVLIMLLGAVTFVLLIACANVGNLLLARSASRQKEIALRVALGASRLRLLRQMLTENILLAMMGGALGLIIARWSLDTVNTLLPTEITRLKAPTINGWVLGFTLLASIITGLLFGLVPAKQAMGRASLGNVYSRLKSGGRGSGTGEQRSLLNFLVTSEVALSLALLIGAALMIRTLLSLHGVDTGFHAENVVHTQIVLPPSQYSPSRQAIFFAQAIDRTRSLPGVQSASAVMCLPLSGSCWSSPVEVEGRSVPLSQSQSEVNFNAAAPEYFRTLGTQLVQGRDFDRRDTKDALPVAIVSQAFVRRYLGGENAIGQRVRERSAKDQSPWATIVGVVGDVRRERLDSPAGAEIYLPFTQTQSISCLLSCVELWIQPACPRESGGSCSHLMAQFRCRESARWKNCRRQDCPRVDCQPYY
jgi:putative ABC transport system permease protein